MKKTFCSLTIVLSVFGIASCDKSLGTKPPVDQTLNVPTIVRNLCSVSQYVATGFFEKKMMTYSTIHFTHRVGSIDEIVSLKFEVENPQTLTSITLNGIVSSPIQGGETILSSLNIAVPDSGINMRFYQNYAPVSGYLPNISGLFSRIILKTIIYKSNGVIKYLMINEGTNFTASNAIKCVHTVPKITVNGYTPIVFGLENKIAEIIVYADSLGDISVNNLGLDIRASGVNNFALSNLRIAENGISIPGATTAIDIQHSFITASLPNLSVTEGSSRKFSLYAVVTGVNTGSMFITLIPSPGNIVWTDKSGNGALGHEDALLLSFYNQAWVLY